MKYALHDSMAARARRSPRRSVVPSSAPAATTTMVPASATADQATLRSPIFSPKNLAAITPTTIGCIEPMIVAFTMLVSFTAEKNRAMSAPSAIPPHIESRMTRSRNGVPWTLIQTISTSEKNANR